MRRTNNQYIGASRRISYMIKIKTGQRFWTLDIATGSPEVRHLSHSASIRLNDNQQFTMCPKTRNFHVSYILRSYIVNIVHNSNCFTIIVGFDIFWRRKVSIMITKEVPIPPSYVVWVMIHVFKVTTELQGCVQTVLTGTSYWIAGHSWSNRQARWFISSLRLNTTHIWLTLFWHKY